MGLFGAMKLSRMTLDLMAFSRMNNSDTVHKGKKHYDLFS
jgi:hypothetical protein